MLKKSPSRNHRNKGIRVKHVLQIALLLGVCFWLLYQLKHSYDKKAVLDEKAAKASIRSLSEGEVLKLGRKDLPHKDFSSKNMKQEEEEEEDTVGDEEEKHEVDAVEEEDQKHEGEEREDEDPTEEQEEEDNKNEDTEEERGAGDDEINELERREGKVDREEDNVDDEKENGDESDEKDGGRNGNEEREDQAKNENVSDNQDKDGGHQNAHEAREEHYKGDDASSAVTHDAQVISTDTEKVSSESANENSGSSILEKEIKSNDAEDVNGNQNNSRLLDDRASENDTVSVAAGEQKVDENLSNPVESSSVNGTMTVHSDEKLEVHNNSTIVSTEVSNSMLEVNQENGTETVSMSAHSQNATLDGMTTGEGIPGETLIVEQTNNIKSDTFHSDCNSTVSSNKEDSHVSEMILRSNGTAHAEDASKSITINEFGNATKNEESITRN